MRSSRVPSLVAGGLGALLCVSCTSGTGEPERPADVSPPPRPTDYTGEPPPGLSGEALRFLHGPGAEGHDILDDPQGVRISSVGDAFLISSGSDDRHLLQDAATGAALWEGEARLHAFGTDRGGAPVFVVRDGEGTTAVVDAVGETVWSGADEREVYLDGVVVRRPDGWSAEEPHGDFAVLDTSGERLWEYSFEEESGDGEDGEDRGDASPEEAEEAGEAENPRVLGVPVTAREDVLLLDSGTGLLQARAIGGKSAGELLWSVSGEEEDLRVRTSAPVALPQVIGVFDLSEEEAAPTPEPGDAEPGDTEPGGAGDAEAGDGTDGDGAEDDGGTGGEDAEDNKDNEDGTGRRDALLVRWTLPEAPSVLSAHDLHEGDLLWTLEEPGANPVVRGFPRAGVTGSVYDAATRTLLVPEASGSTRMIAVDLVGGEPRWAFESGAETSISPAFALEGLFYGDARGAGEDSGQIVLDAETKDVVDDDLPAYVEAVTDGGYAVLVQGRQRFVFGPPPEGGRDAQEEEPAQTPGTGD